MKKFANLRPFQKGQSGNINGRPQGSRHKLGEAFIAVLLADFLEHGAAVIAHVRAEKPGQYLKNVASILPKELNINANGLEALPYDELLAAVRSLDATFREQFGIDIDVALLRPAKTMN